MMATYLLFFILSPVLFFITSLMKEFHHWAKQHFSQDCKHPSILEWFVDKQTTTVEPSLNCLPFKQPPSMRLTVIKVLK